MKIRLGKFVNWDKCEDYIILSNLLDGNVIKLKSPDNSVERLLESRSVENVDDRIIKVLYENNILVDDDINEDELIDQKYYKAVYDNRELHLVIYPTTACNLRCKYCWESNTPSFMSEEVKDRILKFLKREVRYYKSLFVSWFGGEPLLDKKFLINFVQDIKRICLEEKTPFISNITTNGYNLDIDTFTALVKSNLLYYQVTLDGPEAIHNSLRPHADKNCNSYQTILKNLIDIQRSKLKHFNITIRVNVSRELLKNIKEFMSILKQHFAGDKRFSIIWHQIADWGGLNDDAKQLLTEDITDLSRQLNMMSYEYGLRPFVFKPKFNDVLCSACKKNAYIFNIDGTISKCVLCHDIVKDNQTPQNYIQSNGTLFIDNTKEAKWTVRARLSEECRNCSILPICLQAVCPNVRKFTDEERKCTADKSYYKSMLRQLFDDAKEVIIS